ncbi:MAG: hypothetical protein ACRCZQ_04315, partial [Bacteroidales bacterium]
FKRFINKLQDNSVLTKQKRKVRLSSRPSQRPTGRLNEQNQFYTSIIFCGWAFGDNETNPDSEANSAQIVQPSVQPLVQHNIDIKITKDTRRNSACAVPVSDGSKGKEYRKPWYTMEQIAKMDIPNADEILNVWTEYAGRSKKDVLDLLQKFTDNQRLFGLPEMTLDVFDKEFRKEMKSAFALKSKQKNEPVRKLKELGTDD